MNDENQLLPLVLPLPLLVLGGRKDEKYVPADGESVWGGRGRAESSEGRNIGREDDPIASRINNSLSSIPPTGT